MMRSEDENREGAELLRRFRAIVEQMAGEGGVAIEEILVALNHDLEAKRIRQRLHRLDYTDGDIEREVFG